MLRATAKKQTTKPRPKRAKPVATAVDKQAQPEAERPAMKATGYAAGERVSHPLFGEGTVTAVDGDKLTIEFKDGRVKQIVDYYVKRRGQLSTRQG
jgi:hypothetical protein